MTFRKEVIGDCSMYLGDCRDVLPMLGKVDAVVTDPPYGMNWNTDFTRFSGGNHRRGGGRVHKKIFGDDFSFDPSPFLSMDECILFGANHFWDKLPSGTCLVWLKRNDHTLNEFLSDGEIAFKKGGCGVYAFREVFAGSSKAIEAGFNAYAAAAHPTQKTIGVMMWALSFVKSKNILDPFMGSGTTGVACVKLGRKFIGIEREPDYFEIACERIRKAYAQPDMFIAPPIQQAKQEIMI